MSGTNAGSAVLHWLVCDAELCQVVTNHLRLFKRNHRHIFFIMKLTYATYYTPKKDGETKNVNDTDNEF